VKHTGTIELEGRSQERPSGFVHRNAAAQGVDVAKTPARSAGASGKAELFPNYGPHIVASFRQKHHMFWLLGKGQISMLQNVR
jgi:hypothetical protein